jgi:deoxyribonuclease-4
MRHSQKKFGEITVLRIENTTENTAAAGGRMEILDIMENMENAKSVSTKIGSHVGMSGKDMFLNSAREAVSYGADTFMVYTGAPQNTRRKEIAELHIDEGWAYMQQHGIDEIIIHAPYIINLANTIKPETYQLAVDFLALELARSAAMRSRVLVLHPGSHVNAGEEAGIAQIIKGLNEVLRADTACNIALETMAGKGSEIGKTFEQLARIIDGVHYNEKLKICFDTCHVHDSGYDIVNDFDGVIAQFDHLIGKDRIAAFHINDSKNPRGAAKDRHENIGKGYIGLSALQKIVYHPDFLQIPKILETPYIPDPSDPEHKCAPYKDEIALLRSLAPTGA